MKFCRKIHAFLKFYKISLAELAREILKLLAVCFEIYKADRRAGAAAWNLKSKQTESGNLKREQIWLANCGSGVCDGNGAERKFSEKIDI